MSLPSTGIMKKNEKKNMFAREMNRILSLPKKSFQELMEDCKEKGIAQAAKDHNFNPDVLFLAYQNYEEEKAIKERKKQGITRESLICNVQTFVDPNSYIKYIAGRNNDGELLFYQEYSATAMRNLNRILLKNAKQLLTQNTKDMSTNLKKIVSEWKWYIKNEEKINDLKKKAKALIKKKDDKKVWSMLQIRLWELNDPNLTLKALNRRINQQEAFLQRLEQENTKVEEHRITWESIPYHISETNTTGTISEKDFLLNGIFNVTELQCEDLTQIKALNPLGNAKNYTYTMMKKNLMSQIGHFFSTLEQYKLTKEDLTPRLINYYNRYTLFLENINFIDLLNRHQQLEKHPEILSELLTTKIEGYETNIGYLSRTEWFLLDKYFGMNYLVSFEPDFDGHREFYLLETGHNHNQKNPVSRRMKTNIQKMLAELDASEQGTVYTPTFTQLLEHARWFLNEEDPLQIMLDGKAPKIVSERAPIKKKK